MQNHINLSSESLIRRLGGRRIKLIVTLLAVTFCAHVSGQDSGEVIRNELAREYYRISQDQSFTGKGRLRHAIHCLNKADSIEPGNPIILHQRGLVKFNSKHIESGFTDLERSIKYSKEERDLKIRYLNRGLCFMEICDIRSACADWSKAGKAGKKYLDKYCQRDFNYEFHENPDTAVKLKLEIPDRKVTITSPHNPPAMSFCNAIISIHNRSAGEIEILGGLLDYGVEADSSSLYLEAQKPNGEKFIFFPNAKSWFFPRDTVKAIHPGDTCSLKQNITHLHQFPYPGEYKVRVALRPSRILKGINKTYYSNWETLIVGR